MHVKSGWNDLRHAWRSFRRHPRFLLAAVASLALGLGGASAIVGVADALLLHPLSEPHPDRLVLLLDRNPSLGIARMSVSPAGFADQLRETRSFAGLAAYRMEDRTLAGGGAPERAKAVLVSGAFFETLGVPTRLGTAFSFPPGRTPARVAVLSYGLWQRRFGADPRILERTIRLDGAPYVVQGVMPAGFGFPDGAELWCPLALDAAQWADQRAHYLRVVGRLAPGVSLARAQGEVAAVASRHQEDAAEAGWGSFVKSLAAEVTEPVRPVVRLLLAAGALLLGVACGNTSLLLLARGEARSREFATRAALGAGTGRLVRHALTESLALGLAGSGLGLLLAELADRLLVASASPLGPRWSGIGLSPRVTLASLGLAALCGLGAGLFPALRLTGGDLRSRLAAGGTGPGGWRRNRPARLLAAAQLALTFVLLVGTGLLLRSLSALLKVDPGFDPRGVLTLRIDLGQKDYPAPADRAAFFLRAVERLEALPGVDQAGAVSTLPLSGSTNLVRFAIPGRPPSDQDVTPFAAVTPAYFASLRIPVVAGRGFEDEDRSGRPPAAVISQSLAHRLFPGEDAVGQRIRLGDASTPPARIVGVVKDVRGDDLGSPGGPMLYSLFDQAASAAATLCLRTHGDPAALVPAVRRVVAGIDPRLALGHVASLEQVVLDSVADRRLVLAVLAAFAGTALALATVALYGMLSEAVAHATREMGIRAAVGAEPRQLRGLVMGQAAALLVQGLLPGVAAALGLSRLLAAELYAVRPWDAATYAASMALLAVAALWAGWLPARRAARVDPREVLAAE